MPQSYTPIELWEVKPLLEAKGYRFHQTRLFALQLTKPDIAKKFEDTRAPIRHRLGGISRDTLHKILLYSHSAQHAAQQIEDISLGNKLAPEEPSGTVPQAIDEQQIQRLAEAYAENLAAKRDNEAVSELKSQLEEAKAMILELQENAKAASSPAKKKRSRSRKKPDNSNVLGAETELSADQEAMLDQALRNMNPSGE